MVAGMRDTRTGYPAGKPGASLPLPARRPAAARHRRTGSPGRGPARPAAEIVPAVLAGIVLAAGAVVWRSGPSVPPPAPVAQAPTSLGTVSWPHAGVAAADITGLGVAAGPGARRRVPIASVAKVMTAYLVLRDHPLSTGQQGPDIVVRAAEAAAYPAEARSGDSLVPVTAGERISERQSLEALLLPSADNIAWILARWDAGSDARFAARMNAAARALGMTATRYTDPSGLAASTVSSAADQVVLGTAAMHQPVLAAIAGMRSAVIPVAGLVTNYNTLLGQDGIAGLKTGSDSAAGGCVLLASWRDVRGTRSRVLIVAAVLGQPGTAATILPHALRAGQHLMLSLGRALRPRSPRSAIPRPATAAARDRPTRPATAHRQLGVDPSHPAAKYRGLTVATGTLRA
jgi:serine-type D-Ala-D-Ala carboxypeptidase (penicillin-binding protein 5/6)